MANVQESKGPGAWRPILDGTLREQAIDAINGVAEHLRDDPPIPLATGTESFRAARTASLAQGRAGWAVLFDYLDRAGMGDGHPRTAEELLDKAVDALAMGRMESSLYSGFTGVAWAVQHLRRGILDDDENDPNEAIDEALIEHLRSPGWTGLFDLVSGLVGLGVYALERLPRPAAATCLELVIDRLAEMSERTSAGVTWFTPAEWLEPKTRSRYPSGNHNLGVAHGVPGVIALLGGACTVGATAEKARPLLEGAVDWLLGQRLTSSSVSFPYMVPGLDATGSRLAWCYGDPGISTALWCAARGANARVLQEEAIGVIRRAASRPLENSGVVDAGLCHGAAGLGHIFNRMYQVTDDASLRKAARFWFERTLAMRAPQGGIAGFSSWAPLETGDLGWVDDPGLLGGAAGIALALLAAVTPVEPAWDRMLLVSVRGT